MEQPPLNKGELKPLAPPEQLHTCEVKPLAPPQPLHTTDLDDEDENVKQLDGCSSLYLLMQDCVVRSNRNWKECQKEIQALRECSENRKKNEPEVRIYKR